MNHKKALDWLLYRCFEVVFFIYLSFLRILPPNLFRSLFRPGLKMIISLVIPRRRIVKNISAAFGETYSGATKNGLAKGVQENFVTNLLDCFHQLADPEHARRSVAIEGLENLEAALSKNKGVIALGAHIGNFVFVGTRLGAEGYAVSTLFRMPADKRLKSLITRHLPSFHQEVIPSHPRRPAVRRVFEALKRNEIVFILGDNLKRGKVQTLLFGQRVHTPRGPVTLALRSGAALVPMYLIRNYRGGLQLVIEPEMLLFRNGNVYEDVAGNTRQIVRYLEVLIGRYPDQWNWLTVRMKKYRGQVEHAGVDNALK